MSRYLAVFGCLALAAACGSVSEPEVPQNQVPPDPCPIARIATPFPPFAPDLLRARRETVLESIRPGIGIWAAGWDRGLTDGNPKRQNSEFYYLTGIDREEGWLILVAPQTGIDEVIFYVDTTVFLTSASEPAANVLGLTDVRCMSDGLIQLPEMVEAADSPARVGRLWLSKVVLEKSDSLILSVVDTTGIWPGSTLDHLDASRVLKDSDELERLRSAAEMTAEALLAAMRATSPGVSEADLASMIDASFFQAGAARRSFPSMVQSGANALSHHYFDNDSVMTAGDLVVVDVGAEYQRYAADVTRTYPVSGIFTDRQRALYELVLGAQAAAVEAAGPGVYMSEVEDVARDYLRDMSGDLCGDQSCESYFNHRLSHTLGLDVHDVLGYARILEAGMVIAIEPGIYLSAEGVGIRIEDDFVVTSSGAELLSTGVPSTVEDIEAAMAEGPGS